MEIEVEVFKGGEFVLETVTVGDPDSFEIDENNLEGELCKVGAELCFYGSLSADLKAQSARRKMDLEETDSKFALDLRASGEKMTEGHLKERTKCDTTHRKAMEEFINAERNHQRIENFYRSQVKRADCLIALAYSKRQEIKNY